MTNEQRSDRYPYLDFPVLRDRSGRYFNHRPMLREDAGFAYAFIWIAVAEQW